MAGEREEFMVDYKVSDYEAYFSEILPEFSHIIAGTTELVFLFFYLKKKLKKKIKKKLKIKKN